MSRVPNRSPNKRRISKVTGVTERVQRIEDGYELVDRKAQENEPHDNRQSEHATPATPRGQEEPRQANHQQGDRGIGQSAAQIDWRHGQTFFVEEQGARQPGYGEAERDDQPPAQPSSPAFALRFDHAKL